MKDIEFVNTDTNTIKTNVITVYEGLSGRTLAAGDPIRLFLESIASIIAQQRAIINFTGKMNLLAYSEGDYLDHIGALVGCTRLGTEKAKAEALVTLSAAQTFAVTIPAGTRITAGDGLMFAVTETAIIPAGATTANVTVECAAAGEIGNGFVAGQLKQIVDPIAYVASIVNTSTSAGGTDMEKDDAYRERIRIAPESFSVAGPAGAYIYWAKTASSLIADVAVLSPAPGYVEIYPLLEGGELPTQTILDDVDAVCNDERIRPLTDHVSVLSPAAVSYDITGNVLHRGGERGSISRDPGGGDAGGERLCALAEVKAWPRHQSVGAYPPHGQRRGEARRCHSAGIYFGCKIEGRHRGYGVGFFRGC